MGSDGKEYDSIEVILWPSFLKFFIKRQANTENEV